MAKGYRPSETLAEVANPMMRKELCLEAAG
jgi:hypothetical protein